MAVPPETYFVVRLAKRRRQYEARSGFAVEAFLDDLTRTGGFRRMTLSQQSVRNAFNSQPPSDFPNAIRLIYQLYAQERGKSQYGDKTPIYVLYLQQLSSLFPEAKFVHIIRDGRDVVRSFIDGGWANRPEDAAMYWHLQVTRGRRAGRQLGPDRYHELRYEDLVSDPVAALRTLCEFVRIEFDARMLQYQDSARRWAAVSREPQLHSSTLLEPITRLRDWRSEMSRPDLAIVEQLTGRLLLDLGYELGGEDVGVSARLNGRRRWLGWQGRRIQGRLRGVSDSSRRP